MRSPGAGHDSGRRRPGAKHFSRTKPSIAMRSGRVWTPTGRYPHGCRIELARWIVELGGNPKLVLADSAFKLKPPTSTKAGVLTVESVVKRDLGDGNVLVEPVDLVVPAGGLSWPSLVIELAQRTHGRPFGRSS